MAVQSALCTRGLFSILLINVPFHLPCCTVEFNFMFSAIHIRGEVMHKRARLGELGSETGLAFIDINVHKID